MESSFEKAFAYMFFLVMSADKVAHLDEFIILNKILRFEKIEKKSFMSTIDQLSNMENKDIYAQGIELLKSLSEPEQKKCLAYMLLIAKADGDLHLKEDTLMHKISSDELNIPFEEISGLERKIALELPS